MVSSKLWLVLEGTAQLSDDPLASLPHRAEHIVVGRLLLNMIRHSHVVNDGRHGNSADFIIIGWAITVHQLEGKPINKSKLAAIAGIPRATVYRRLAYMQERGFLVEDDHGNLSFKPELFFRDTSLERVRKLMLSARQAVRKLDEGT